MKAIKPSTMIDRLCELDSANLSQLSATFPYREIKKFKSFQLLVVEFEKLINKELCG